MPTTSIQIGFQDYLQIMFHRKWLILGGLIISVGLFGLHAFTAEEVFEASNDARIVSEFRNNPIFQGLVKSGAFHARLAAFVRELKSTEGLKRIVATVDGLAAQVPSLGEIQEPRLPILRDRLTDLEARLDRETDPFRRRHLLRESERMRGRIEENKELIARIQQGDALDAALDGGVPAAGPSRDETRRAAEQTLRRISSRLRASIRVGLQGTDFISVSCQWPDGAIAKDVVDAIIDDLELRNDNFERQQVGSAGKILLEEIAKIQEEVDRIEMELNGITNVEPLVMQGSLLANNPGQAIEKIAGLPQPKNEVLIQFLGFQNELEEVQAQLAAKERALVVLEEEIARTAPTVSRIVEENHQGPAAAEVQRELVAARRELSEVLLTSSELHPTVQRLRKQIADLEATHEELLRTFRSREIQEPNTVYGELASSRRAHRFELEGLRARERRLIRLSEGKIKNMQNLARLQRRYNELELEYAARRQSLQDFRQRYESAVNTQKFEVERRGTYFQKLDATVLPRVPVQPNRPVLLALGILAGLFVSSGLVFFAEYADHSIRSVADVRRHIELPVLGAISEFELQEEEIFKLTKGGFAWAIRRLTVPVLVLAVLVAGFLVLRRMDIPGLSRSRETEAVDPAGPRTTTPGSPGVSPQGERRAGTTEPPSRPPDGGPTGAPVRASVPDRWTELRNGGDGAATPPDDDTFVPRPLPSSER